MTVQSLTPMLSVIDLARTIAFYRDALDFEVVGDFEPGGKMVWCCLEREGVRIMFNEIPDAWVEASDREARKFQIYYFKLDDAVALHAEVSARGFACTPLRVTIYNTKEFEMRDPDHSWLWFGQETDEPPTVTPEEPGPTL